MVCSKRIALKRTVTEIQYCNIKYAPFDKNANGNIGYLYGIDNKLVSVFLKETAKNNNEIAELDYIQWLL